MHEMSLCESILEILESAAAREGFETVRKVRVEVGKFSGVEPDALRFGFDVVTRGSVAEGAELIILEPPGRGFCFDCTETVELSDRLAPCPRCGGGRITPAGGDSMRIKDLEVA
jgi:hydrogenase nickel incorporation protein HypA/HybF